MVRSEISEPWQSVEIAKEDQQKDYQENIPAVYFPILSEENLSNR